MREREREEERERERERERRASERAVDSVIVFGHEFCSVHVCDRLSG